MGPNIDPLCNNFNRYLETLNTWFMNKGLLLSLLKLSVTLFTSRTREISEWLNADSNNISIEGEIRTKVANPKLLGLVFNQMNKLEKITVLPKWGLPCNDVPSDERQRPPPLGNQDPPSKTCYISLLFPHAPSERQLPVKKSLSTTSPPTQPIAPELHNPGVKVLCTEVVTTAINNARPNKVIDTLPHPISADEVTLPRTTRTTLAQLTTEVQLF